ILRFGPSLLVCLLVGFNRGIRFGLCVAALLLAHMSLTGREADQIYAGRSYFGVLRVYMDFDHKDLLRDEDLEKLEGSDKLVFDKGGAPFTYLMHGTTYHGKNFHYPPELRRLATTYYHRKGPVGVIMERFNWGSPTEEERKANPKLKVPLQNTYY